MAYVMALDQGTTSSRAILFDQDGVPVATAQREFTQVFPKPGWVEHDPEEIWSTQAAVATEALGRARVRAADVTAVGITNQRETVVVWDRATGQPVCNAIVWQDRRTADHCDRLRADGLTETFRGKTGLVIDPYFSGTKLAWVLDNIDGARKRAERGELAFGTIDSWLVYKLTNGDLHITDVTNASRTLLFNIHTCAWDDALLEALNIPRSLLPEVRSSCERYADVSNSLVLTGCPIGGIVGDQQAATLGQACVHPGDAKNTYGTGCFLVMNTGDNAKASNNQLLTTIAWQRGARVDYALEGSVFVAGAIVQWLRDGLGIIRNSADVEKLAATVEDNGGVYLVPALTGLGAPHWDAHARGVIVGLTRGTTAGHIARAALEGIAYQVADLVAAMQMDAGATLTELRVDGGAAANDALMQFQADILQVPVVRPTVLETTALGAAYLGGLATGVWSSVEEISVQWRAERRFDPSMAASQVNALRERWQEAVGRCRGWDKPTGPVG